MDATWDSRPKCPSCGHFHEDAWELFLGDEYGDGEATEMECDGCGLLLEITMHIETTYETSVSE